MLNYHTFQPRLQGAFPWLFPLSQRFGHPRVFVKTLGIWEWGCPKRGDAHITVTPLRPTSKAREKRPGDEIAYFLNWVRTGPFT